jgi:glucose-6-phosphate 1-dehydrogenase
VQITVAERVGMEGRRGQYYDTAGATRDMVQNHMMQILSLVAMEPPVAMDARAIRDEKVKVLRAIRPLHGEQILTHCVRGQYGAGSFAGQGMKGYREEEGVAPDSRTETYLALKLFIDTWRWSGVPFYLRTGKRLPKRVTEIAIQFRSPPMAMFDPALQGSAPGVADPQILTPRNQLILRVQPDEGISLSFDAKVPGMRMALSPVKMDFRYGSSFGGMTAEAYERLLLDAMLGDSTLFIRSDEVEYSWRLISPLLEAWAAAPSPDFPNYVAGTWGPAEADKLFDASGGEWRRL